MTEDYEADVAIVTNKDFNEAADKFGIPPIVIICIGKNNNLNEKAAIIAATQWKSAITAKPDTLFISIDGYDDDPRELWMIPEVTKYVKLFVKHAEITLQQAVNIIPDDRGAGLLAACGVFGTEVQRADWFEDYNDNHPHSGLKMRSPREFRSAQIVTV